MADLKFYYGTMGAGKTTEALKTYEIYRRKGWKPIILKPSVDDREGKFVGWGTTKSRLIPDERPAYYTTDVWSFINNPPQEYGILIVDEAQFFSKKDIWALSSIADDRNTNVICYGLKTDCNGNLFEGAAALLAIADETREIDNLCDICGQRKPVMHARYIDGKLDLSSNPVAIEKGNVVYKAVCRKCKKMEVAKWRERE